jgi:hypothetical protein
MNTTVASTGTIPTREDAPRASNPILGEIVGAARDIGIFTALAAGWTVLNVGLYLHRL